MSVTGDDATRAGMANRADLPPPSAPARTPPRRPPAAPNAAEIADLHDWRAGQTRANADIDRRIAEVVRRIGSLEDRTAAWQEETNAHLRANYADIRWAIARTDAGNGGAPPRNVWRELWQSTKFRALAGYYVTALFALAVALLGGDVSANAALIAFLTAVAAPTTAFIAGTAYQHAQETRARAHLAASRPVPPSGS